MWIMVSQNNQEKQVFKDRLKRETSGDPLEFLCLAVARCNQCEAHFLTTNEVAAWVKAYWKLEDVEINRYMTAVAVGAVALPLPPATILVLVDPLPDISGSTSEEWQRREALTEAGAILIERDESCGEDDEGQFAKVVESILAGDTQTPLDASGISPQEEPCFLNWEPSLLESKDEDTAAYLLQSSLKELPDNAALKRIFKTYKKADRHDLDY